MIATLLRYALQQRFITVVMAIVLTGAGIYSFRQLKIEAYPDISDTQVTVITSFPGHAAEEMEQQVTVPLERALNSVPNVIARRSRTIRTGRRHSGNQQHARQHHVASLPQDDRQMIDHPGWR